MKARIGAYPGGIQGFSKAFGWSTRLNQLLAGKLPWTLEDISRVCEAFDIDPLEYVTQIGTEVREMPPFLKPAEGGYMEGRGQTP